MLRLPFSSLPLFSFFLPLFHPLIHTYTQTRVHTHIHTHIYITHHTTEFPAFSDTHTHIRFVNYPVASETSTRPRKVCPPPCTGFRGWATPWKIALLHDTISPGFAIPSYVRCSWEAEKNGIVGGPIDSWLYRFPPPTFLSFLHRQSRELWNFTTL